MTEKVTILYEENLPMPLIYLHSAGDLASWQVSQLEWAYAQGHRDLAISCFQTGPMGFDTGSAAAAVLQAVMDFLDRYPTVERLRIICGDRTALFAYTLHWNTRYGACCR